MGFVQLVARPDLVKVGPKGYIHGWIFVGPPGIKVGRRVNHSHDPKYGRGTVTHLTDDQVTVKFDNGKVKSFQRHPETPDKHHFAKRPRARASKTPVAAGSTFDRRTAQDIYEFKSTSGISTKVRSVNTRDGGVVVTGSINSAEGKMIGGFRRTITPGAGTVENTEVVITDPAFQGQRFGDEFYTHTEQALKAHGIHTVTLFANSDVGGYAWARRGYDWDAGRYKDRKSVGGMTPIWVATEIKSFLSYRESGLSKADRAVLEGWAAKFDRAHDRMDFDGLPSPKELAEFGMGRYKYERHTKAGKPYPSWPGKDIMLRTAWYGTKTLKG